MKTALLVVGLIWTGSFCNQITAAQFTIKLPKLHRVEKPRTDQSKTDGRNAENPSEATPVSASPDSRPASLKSGDIPYGSVRRGADLQRLTEPERAVGIIVFGREFEIAFMVIEQVEP